LEVTAAYIFAAYVSNRKMLTFSTSPLYAHRSYLQTNFLWALCGGKYYSENITSIYQLPVT